MRKLGLIFILAAVCSGCSLGHTSHSGEHITVSGTPEGMRAFGDTLVGVMKTSKEAPDVPNQYFVHRASYEQQVTTRSARPSFFQKLFSEEQGS